MAYNSTEAKLYVFSYNSIGGQVYEISNGVAVPIAGASPDLRYAELDGNTDTARIWPENFSMKYYDDKRWLMFDRGHSEIGNRISYIDMNGLPVMTPTSTNYISPTPTFTVTPYLSPTSTMTITPYLSPTVTNTRMPSCWDNNVVAHYACDENSGGFLADDVGGYNAVIAGTLTFATDPAMIPPVAWAKGSCSGMQVAGNYFKMPLALNTALANSPDGWTIELYVYKQATGNYGIYSLFTKGAFDPDLINLLHSDISEDPSQLWDDGAVRLFAPGVNAQTAGGESRNGAWIHWAYA